MPQYAKSNIIRVRSMLDYARKAIEYCKNKTRDDLDNNELLALATVHLVGMMCRTAQVVTAEFRERHPEIPWEQISGTGERIADTETEVDMDVIWAIVTRDLPPLLVKFRKIIRGEGQ